MNDLVNLFLNAGVSIVVIAYFMFRDFKFMSTLQNSLNSLNEAVELIEKYFINEVQNKKGDDGK